MYEVRYLDGVIFTGNLSECRNYVVAEFRHRLKYVGAWFFALKDDGFETDSCLQIAPQGTCCAVSCDECPDYVECHRY